MKDNLLDDCRGCLDQSAKDTADYGVLVLSIQLLDRLLVCKVSDGGEVEAELLPLQLASSAGKAVALVFETTGLLASYLALLSTAVLISSPNLVMILLVNDMFSLLIVSLACCA